LETFVIDSLERSLQLDPMEELEARIEIAEHMLRRAREELEEGDAVQASEKLYRAVEECIKILACLEGLEECRRAREEGQWWPKLLSKAARKLTAKLGTSLPREAWEEAYDLHVHGFHEHALSVNEVKQSLPVIEKLLEYVKGRLGRLG
jgi:HEPN domain-containing protein